MPQLVAGAITGAAIDTLLVSEVEACLADPAAELDRPVELGSEFPASVRDGFASMKHLTEGARGLVGRAGSLNETLRHIFKDKSFRAYLRETISDQSMQPGLNRLIAAVSALDKNVPIAQPPPPAPVAAATFPPLPDELEGYSEFRFPYKLGKEERAAGLPELVALLADPDGLTWVAGQLSGLLKSDSPQIVILLHRLDEVRRLQITPEASALLKVFAARVYLQFNAAESASALAQSALDDREVLQRLSAGEQLRLRNVLARSALRSGRGAEAVEIYSDILAQIPSSPSALMNVVGSAFATDPPLACGLARMALANNYSISDEDLIFIGDLLTVHGDFEQAQIAFFRALHRSSDYADAYIGLSNLYRVSGRPKQWLRYFSRYFEVAAGLKVEIDSEQSLTPFAIRHAPLAPVAEHPRVTVVMTTFNAGDTVDLAIASVLGQVLQNIEVIVIDDCSEDDSRERVIEIAQRDPRVRWLHNDRNVGTYVSKNRGIEVATGDYITFHDSDDWMHPRRLLDHLETMVAGYACSTSNWLRMDGDGRAIVRRGGPYTHLNPASSFIPKPVLDRIGPFDEVRTGADSEIVTRLKMSYGRSAVRHLSTCLGLGLHREDSLTRSGAAAFDEFRYSPVRLSYTEQWLAWHLKELESGPKEVILRHEGGQRKFPIPDALNPG